MEIAVLTAPATLPRALLEGPLFTELFSDL
jgi:hypothetical protein